MAIRSDPYPVYMEGPYFFQGMSIRHFFDGSESGTAGEEKNPDPDLDPTPDPT